MRSRWLIEFKEKESQSFWLSRPQASLVWAEDAYGALRTSHEEAPLSPELKYRVSYVPAQVTPVIFNYNPPAKGDITGWEAENNSSATYGQ